MLEKTQLPKKSTGMYKTRAVIVFAVICTIVLKILVLLLQFVAAHRLEHLMETGHKSRIVRDKKKQRAL